jgi:hypothetical protein
MNLPTCQSSIRLASTITFFLGSMAASLIQYRGQQRSTELAVSPTSPSIPRKGRNGGGRPVILQGDGTRTRVGQR